MRVLLLVLLFTACQSVPVRVQTGMEVPAPAGYLEMCIRTPHVPECN